MIKKEQFLKLLLLLHCPYLFYSILKKKQKKTNQPCSNLKCLLEELSILNPSTQEKTGLLDLGYMKVVLLKYMASF